MVQESRKKSSITYFLTTLQDMVSKMRTAEFNYFTEKLMVFIMKVMSAKEPHPYLNLPEDYLTAIEKVLEVRIRKLLSIPIRYKPSKTRREVF